VQAGGQSSAAIPKKAVGQAHRLPSDQAHRPPSAAAGAAALQKPPAKSKTPLLIGLGAAAAIGIAAFVMLSGG
jgi:hypothetical protein